MFKTFVNSIMDAISDWLLNENELKAAFNQLEFCVKSKGVKEDAEALDVIKKSFESLIFKTGKCLGENPEWVKFLNTNGQYMVIDHPTTNEDMAVLIKSENPYEVYSKLSKLETYSFEDYESLKEVLEDFKKSGLVKDFGVIMRVEKAKIFQP